jgi:hypothetical protein
VQTQPTFEMESDVAIIGVSGRFPGAGNVDELWQNLRDGVESIRALSAEELAGAGVERLMMEAQFLSAGVVGKKREDATIGGNSRAVAQQLDQCFCDWRVGLVHGDSIARSLAEWRRPPFHDAKLLRRS